MKNPANNPTGREALKGITATVGAVGVTIAGGHGAVIAQAIVSSLSVAIEYFGRFSAKRTNELFDSDTLIDATVEKISKSDDFASFVFDLWQRHNLESSGQRRRMLKAILEKEVLSERNEFENFSKLEFLVQNMSIESLRLLKFFNTTIYKTTFRTQEGELKRPNLREIADIAAKTDYRIPYQDLDYRMGDLANNGLVAITHGLWDGPEYNQSKLGFLLLNYISETID